MSAQPVALRLAESLERDCDMNWPDYDNQMNAAAELRRLHAVNSELVEFAQRFLQLKYDKEQTWMTLKAKAAIAKAGEQP